METPEILYCDNHLLVGNKPSGLSTQPHDGIVSFEDVCKQWLKIRFAKPGAVYLQAVHRIDKPVSGIVLFARTSKSLSRLQEFQREHKFEKMYLAVVEGCLTGEDRLEHWLNHGAFRAVVSDKKQRDGKLSILKYSALKNYGRYTLLQILLETGRYHQIRAQLSFIGHPIVGDQKYGSSESSPLLLHHSQLKAVHPISRAELLWLAPLPIYWPAALIP